MNKSVCSRASNASSQMLEELANKSTARFLRTQGTFNDEEMRVIWNALGLYISRNLKMGRGITIPKLGVFTFTPPEVRLKGVTNQKQRDLKPRVPVFLIQKQFVKGLPLKTAIFYHQQFGAGLRPYAALGATGEVPVTKMNLLQVSTYANMSKDATQLAINRIIKYISEKLLAGQSLNIQIPHVGQLISRNGLVAVKYNEHLYRDTRTVLSKSLDERVKKGNMSLTSDNLKKFARLSEMNHKLANSSQQFLDIDENTKNFLQTQFGFHSTDNKQVMKNSLTNFGRTFASRQFDTRNNLLKSSQISRMTQSGFLTNKVRNFNREYNMALRIVKQWVMNKCPNAANSFNDFVKLAKKSNPVLNENDVWEACKQISTDITEQQSDQLFRLLDANKDGFVTKDDWNKNIAFDNNALIKSTVEIVRRKNLKAASALTQMGLAGISKTDVHTLKNALKKLNEKLNDEQALFLSRYICKGKDQASIETILQVLQLNQSNNVYVDQQWQEKFLKRLRKKMYDRNILQEELESRLRLYDKSRSGYIEQADLKSVLGELGISLTLSELVKIVKIFPINEKNHIRYSTIIEKLELTDIEDNQPITYEQFVKTLKEKFFNKDALPISLPISVRKLTSQLQSTIFKSEQQSHLIKFVRKMDVNQNDQVTMQDIKAYKQQIRDPRTFSAEQTCPIALQTLVIKLREKSIKKKISYYDLFNKLDTNKNGFITLEEWNKNIGSIIPLSEEEKQLLFNYLDVSKLKMIDYKTFLSFMNGTGGAVAENEKFDWVDQCVSKIQQWFKESGLTVTKSFKLVDSDGDCYISEKDLNSFLVNKIKYQPRQLSHVRLQKVLKVLDTYKRAKVDQNDWERLVKGEKVNWLNEAKQQIGIVLSKRYSSLTDAFYEITQGDQKLLFSSFRNWVENKKVLSGFIANQDILKKLYSELDVHKKGYLLENDFISCFGVFNWRSEQTKQFLHKLKSKFASCQEAYKCMNAYNKGSLDFNRFYKFVEELFGNRFKKSDAKNIWNNLAIDNQLPLAKFKERAGQQWTNAANPIDKQFPKDDWQYEDFSIIKGTQIRTDEFQYDETQKLESQVRKIVKNVKEMLAASHKTLEQAFQEVDTEKTGKLNNLQFKKAFRLLNIALTAKQLDLLLNYSDYKVETLIDWKEFVKRFNLNEDEIKMNNRIQTRLQHISDLLHYYMITPKDAYRKWNNPRTGYMNFEEFHKMIKQLYSQANETLPQLALLKETFAQIDIRRDDILDFQQFTQTFRNCKPPSLLMGTVPADKKGLKHKVTDDPEKDMPVRETEIPLFKHSPQYEEFVRFVGRNRKYIQQKLEAEVGKQQRLIPYEVVKTVIKDVASYNKLCFTDNIIRNSIAFSMTGDKVDYRLLTDSFKGRGEDVVQFPMKKMF